MSRRGRGRNAKVRKARAITSRDHLENLLKEPWGKPELSVNSAAKDIMNLSKKHRLGLPDGRRSWICRSCKLALRPGVNASVRVRGKIWRITCLSCGGTNRRGPSYYRGDDK
jgi:RNase P subunit RPR2